MNRLQVMVSHSPSAPRQRRVVASLLAAAIVAAATSAAAGADPTARGWGDGSGLGLDSVASVSPPRDIPGMPPAADALAIATGLQRTLVLAKDGVLVTTIGGGFPGLGAGVEDARTLTPIPNTGDVIAVSSGQDASLLLREDGTVWGFGRNEFGSAGAPPVSGTPGGRVFVPTQVKKDDGTPLSGIVAIASAGQHSLALDGDGNVWAWGNHLRLGNAAAAAGGVATNIPHKVALPGPADQIAAGNEHSLALLDDGTVYGWGVNTNGQLGNGTIVTPTDRLPVKVQGLDGLDVKSVTAGWRFSLALLEDGTHRGWGQNAAGALGLGLGSTANVTVATARNPAAPAPPAFDEISAGRLSAYAISQPSGNVYAWGHQGTTSITGKLGGIALNPFPFGSATAITATSATEIPQRVGNLREVPWLAVGGTAEHQILYTEPTLRKYSVTDQFFFSQQVGTTSKPRRQSVQAIGANININRVRIAGPNASDFHFVRNGTATAIDSYTFPHLLSTGQGGVFGLDVQFVPTDVGVRTAQIVFEAEGETVSIELEGLGVPLTGGPAGGKGDKGEKGDKGDKGADGSNGVVVFAATRSRVTVKRGKRASLPFLVVNGSASRLVGTTATASLPKSLRAARRAGKATRVAPLAAGGVRRFTVPVQVGKHAKLGAHLVRVAFKNGTKTTTRTVRVVVTR